MKHTILCVDDERDNVDALERLFRKKFDVLKATSGADALQLIANRPVSLIISDQRMPQMTGIQFFEKTMETHPDTVRVLLTGYTDVESVISAINTGQIYRYITKPWDPRDLLVAVDRAIERYEMRTELKKKNEDLFKALQELKSLDEAKSHFMILINHELRTPLTAALSFLELLKESKLDDGQKVYLDRINKSMDRLKEIVFDVLELTSAEMGILPLDIRKTNLQEVTRDLFIEFEPLAAQKKQKLKIQIDSIPVWADIKLIRSVIRRVLQNAIKFGWENSLVETSTSETKEGVKVAIENQAETLSTDMINQILKPFALNENIMNHSKGLGIGLSLCRALLKHHSSDLSIQSSNNKICVSFFLKKS